LKKRIRKNDFQEVTNSNSRKKSHSKKILSNDLINQDPINLISQGRMQTSKDRNNRQGPINHSKEEGRHGNNGHRRIHKSYSVVSTQHQADRWQLNF
jgi:hypothetical protein